MSQLSRLDMFRPPVDRAMRVLDRSFFQKRVHLPAAAIFENSQIGPCRSLLGREILHEEGLSVVQPLAGNRNERSGQKVLLLNPEIRANDSSTWGDKLRQLVAENKVAVTTYDLNLKYDFWDYFDIISAILPEESTEDIPTGFSIAGHVAHLNLRERYFPYKHLIAQVLLDKNPQLRTVINKTDTVGTQSEYRTFQYELLAGDPSLDVEIKEQNCAFRFNYAEVYWNSRLNTEHERLVGLFNPGEAICDVMAGVGPFAVPAGKKKVFVWANDLNPASYKSLEDAIQRNKVDKFVKPFNMDGREFIRQSAQAIMKESRTVDITPAPRRVSRSAPPAETPAAERKFLTQPKTFDHYVMNLPATAIEFLDAFVGLHKGQEKMFAPFTNRRLPMVHVHCFSTKSDDNKRETVEIWERISNEVGFVISSETPEAQVYDVRDVAPKKRMFCASFRLPPEVAFR